MAVLQVRLSCPRQPAQSTDPVPQGQLAPFSHWRISPSRSSRTVWQRTYAHLLFRADTNRFPQRGHFQFSPLIAVTIANEK